MLNLKILKTRGDFSVNIDVSFPSTGLFIISGPNGSGKSTLYNLLAGFDTEGLNHLTYNSNVITKENLDSYQNDVSYITQDALLIPTLSVADNLRIGFAKISNEQIKVALAKVNLSNFEKTKVETLSTGEKQRVAIAKALLKNPKIILADEITSALDSKNASDINDILKELSKSMLVILSTHYDELITDDVSVISVDETKDINEILYHTKESEASIPLQKVHGFKALWRNFFSFFKSNIWSLIISDLLICAFSTMFLFLGSLSIFDYHEAEYQIRCSDYVGIRQGDKVDSIHSDKEIYDIFIKHDYEDKDFIFEDRFGAPLDPKLSDNRPYEYKYCLTTDFSNFKLDSGRFPINDNELIVPFGMEHEKQLGASPVKVIVNETHLNNKLIVGMMTKTGNPPGISVLTYHSKPIDKLNPLPIHLVNSHEAIEGFRFFRDKENILLIGSQKDNYVNDKIAGMAKLTIPTLMAFTLILFILLNIYILYKYFIKFKFENIIRLSLLEKRSHLIFSNICFVIMLMLSSVVISIPFTLIVNTLYSSGIYISSGLVNYLFLSPLAFLILAAVYVPMLIVMFFVYRRFFSKDILQKYQEVFE